MLRLRHILPARAHIAGLRVAHAVRVQWWRIARVTVRGCRVLVLNGAGQVLLIRHSYGSGEWMLPGGGLARGEDPLTGGLREVWEETRVRLDPAVELGCFTDPVSRHEAFLLAGWTADEPCADGREIVEARFFAAHALPETTSAKLRERLPGWITAATTARPAG